MGDVVLGEGTTIHPSARINVTGYLYIGDSGTVGPNCVIEGLDIRIGHELWMDEGAVIGGGSCFEPQSKLRAGHFLHMGRGSLINTARPVSIGHEVGLGTGTKLYTHGAYLSALDGFPVAFGPITLGDCVWIPGAVVNPGVSIGSDVVVGVNSLVTSDLPDGCLAGGSPAKILRSDTYPRPLEGDALDDFWRRFLADYPDEDAEIWVGREQVRVGETRFVLTDRHITGPVTHESETLRNQLRRYGIRFWSRPHGETYRDWR